MANEQDLYEMFMDFIRNPHPDKIVNYVKVHEQVKGVLPSGPRDTQEVRHGDEQTKQLDAESTNLQKAYDAWKKRYAEEGTYTNAPLEWHFGGDDELLHKMLVTLDQLYRVFFGKDSDQKIAEGSQSIAPPVLIAGFRLKTTLCAAYTSAGGTDDHYKKPGTSGANYTHGQVEEYLKAVFAEFGKELDKRKH